jgi:hypothetical protein
MTTPETTNEATEVPSGGTETTVDGLVSATVRPHEIEKVRVRRQREGLVALAAVSDQGGAVEAWLILDEDSALDLAGDLERVARDGGVEL